MISAGPRLWSDNTFNRPRSKTNTRSATNAASISDALNRTPHPHVDSATSERSRSPASCVARIPSRSSNPSTTINRGALTIPRANPTSTRSQSESSSQRFPAAPAAPTRSSACTANARASHRLRPRLRPSLRHPHSRLNANDNPTKSRTFNRNPGPSRSVHAISLANNRERSRSEHPAKSFPPNHTSPASGRSNPAATRNNVDLPSPCELTTATTSPTPTPTDKPANTAIRRSPRE